MNQKKQNVDVWQVPEDKEKQTADHLDDQFVKQVVAQVQRKFIYRDIIALILVGFSSVLVELLRAGIW
ncbi:MAG: hypothetical protein ACI8V2_003265 [Candidatus Latescibacterota bacterium]